MLINILKIIFFCFIPSQIVVFLLMKYTNLRNSILYHLITTIIFFGLIILLVRW